MLAVTKRKNQRAKLSPRIGGAIIGTVIYFIHLLKNLKMRKLKAFLEYVFNIKIISMDHYLDLLIEIVLLKDKNNGKGKEEN